MFRKDLMTTEMQQLAQVLARIFGLKIDGLVLEADEEIGNSLKNDFGLDLVDLENFTAAEFDQYLRKQEFSKDKIEVLSQLLYAKIDSFENTEQNKDIAERLLQLYDFIEIEHNTSSFEILNRKVKLKQLLDS